jgi:hypothetical protein
MRQIFLRSSEDPVPFYHYLQKSTMTIVNLSAYGDHPVTGTHFLQAFRPDYREREARICRNSGEMSCP